MPSLAAVGLMLLGLVLVYCPPAVLDGSGALLGVDYNNIHARRIAYAQEALAGPAGHLPAWHTRELFGSPFWSNIQSFPPAPTRLLLLGLDTSVLYSVAVILGAFLAGLFTFLYCRKLGLGPLASAAAGWTFAASGYFASRVLAGHLPLLEAFHALPLLLWIVECIARSEDGRRRYVGLALAVLAVALSGHPQLPVYAIGAAGLYVLVRLRGARALRALASIAAGLGLASFVWWPMLRLIGRSTRVLDLARAENDVALPYWRLKSFLFPWADGWPPLVDRSPATSFVDPVRAHFWDTVVYVSWLPLLAIVFLLGRAIVRRLRPSAPWLFLVAVSVGALLLALPLARDSIGSAGWTLLRSPARLLYLTTFGLAVGLGAFVNLLLARRALLAGVGAVLLLVHAVDLARHDACFVKCIERRPAPAAEIEAARRELGDRRAAIDFSVYVPENRRVDDVGFFDSIVLARPYRVVTALAGLPEGTNVQTFDGSSIPAPALAALGVARVVTKDGVEDLSDPAPRASFVPDANDPFPDPVVEYERPDPDHIVVRVRASVSGSVRVLESFDEGWTATLDGGRVPVLIADGFAMAVRVPGGDHEVRLEYRTPGARVGWCLTAASALLLAAIAFGPLRRRQ